MAAAAPTSTADSITGLGETLKNLISINTAGFAEIGFSLRKQNSILTDSLGKNLQLIADAITSSSDDLLSQMTAEARLEAEKWKESQAKLGGGDAPAVVEATDMSLDLSITGILAGLAVFLVGFVSGYIAELKAIGGGLKNFIMAIGKDAKAIWNVGKGWLGKTKFGKWVGRMKSWFNAKISMIWKPFTSLWNKSGIKTWYSSFKAFFTPTINKSLSMKHHTKIMNESGIMKMYGRIKTFFSKKIPIKLPNVGALWASAKGGIGGFFTKIKTLFGKSKFLTELGKGVTRIKSMFTAGGPGLFAQLSTWFKSFKIPFPKWLTDIIAKAKGLTGEGKFLGKLGPTAIFSI